MKWKINVESCHKSRPALERESVAAGGGRVGYKKVVDIAMGGLQYDDPLLCICAIVIAFDRKLNFLYSEKAYFKGLYLYKDKLLCRRKPLWKWMLEALLNDHKSLHKKLLFPLLTSLSSPKTALNIWGPKLPWKYRTNLPLFTFSFNWAAECTVSNFRPENHNK